MEPVNQKVYIGFGVLMVLVTLFLPDVSLGGGIPSLQAIDFLLPFAAILLFLRRKEIQFNRYYLLLAIFSIYILITIVINGNTGVLNQYFETYKILKFGLLIAYFSLIPIAGIKPWIKPTFVVLVLFNLIHFFDLFGFNSILQYQYAGDLNIQYFGKNTLGMPACKRMVGFMSNPNNNALLFLFFAIHFMKEKLSKWDFLWLTLALVMAFMCQSKTSILVVAGVIILAFAFKLLHFQLNTVLTYAGIIGGSFLFAMALCTNFFEYPAYSSALLDGRSMHTYSVMGRLEAWRFLGEMIIQKPIFGYGPDKNFFYENHIYSENEYILYTWRYGFIGLLLFLGILIGPFVIIRKRLREVPHLKLALFTCLMLIAGLTNNPFTERHLAVLFAFVIGITFFHFYQSKKVGNG